MGVVCPRFTLFDEQLGAGFVTRTRAVAAYAERVLGQWCDVAATLVVDSDASADDAATRLAAETLDAIVVAPCMAAPPTFAWAVLSARPDTPVVIWNALTQASLPTHLTQAQATENTTTVGCLMLGNVCARAGRAYAAVTTSDDQPGTLDVLRRTVIAAAAAGRLRGATVLRVGAPLDGYADVTATADDLAALGLRERDVPAGELEEAFLAAGDADGRAVLDACRAAGWHGQDDAPAMRSARLAHALTTLACRHGAVAGTVNCHGPMLRFGACVGIPACLAVARETSQGRPFSCTGNQPVAITMLLARRLAGAALYHECYAPEPATGLMLVVGGPEADPACADGRVDWVDNVHYPGQAGQGAGLSFRLREGPATMMSASPTADGWVLAWATGCIEAARYGELRGPNGMFRFDSADAMDAATRWITSGATHHGALAPGRLDVEIPVVAEALGMRAVRV